MNANPHEVFQWLVSWRRLFEFCCRGGRTASVKRQQPDGAGAEGSALT